MILLVGVVGCCGSVVTVMLYCDPYAVRYFMYEILFLNTVTVTVTVTAR